MKKTTETTAVATTSTKKTNAQKTNVILSHTALLESVQASAVGHQCKVFTDNANYVGIGKKCNGFSVNVKKTKYNVFCNDENYEMLSKDKQFGSCTFTKDGNKCDRTRPHHIAVSDTNVLLEMIKAVLVQYKPTAAVDNN